MGLLGVVVVREIYFLEGMLFHHPPLKLRTGKKEAIAVTHAVSAYIEHL